VLVGGVLAGGVLAGGVLEGGVVVLDGVVVDPGCVVPFDWLDVLEPPAPLQPQQARTTAMHPSVRFTGLLLFPIGPCPWERYGTPRAIESA
jgi:hypothetical protein